MQGDSSTLNLNQANARMFRGIGSGFRCLVGKISYAELVQVMQLIFNALFLAL